MELEVEVKLPILNEYRQLAGNVHPQQRLLLLPHCLRPSQGCPGKMTRQGLICDGCTRRECKVWQLRAAALEAGYGNICVAPGGRLAVRQVAETNPQAIIAVACDRELQEGVQAVQSLEWDGPPPPIIQIPLLVDGCVETELDIAYALEVIAS
jgi:geranylgeranyl diphosphate synthase type II